MNDNDLAVVSVLSGNRNFEGRINPDVKMNYLMSPPLVVAYALAGTMDLDITTEPLGTDTDGNDVFLKDIWPSSQEIQEVVDSAVRVGDVQPRLRRRVHRRRDAGRTCPTPTGNTFEWDPDSTYVRKPPYFEGMPADPQPVTDIEGARVLAGARRLGHHRPHLAGRARSRPTRRPGRTCRSTASTAATSTPTARAAATTR